MELNKHQWSRLLGFSGSGNLPKALTRC